MYSIKYFTSTFIILLFSLNIYAKSKWNLSGKIDNFNGNLTCVIYSFKDGIELKISDIESSSGTISFSFNESTEEGVFRIVLTDNKNSRFFDIILTNEENSIIFNYDFKNEQSVPVFSESNANQNWYTFIKHDIENKRDVSELEVYQKSVLKRKGNLNTEDIQKTILDLKNNFTKFKDKFTANNKNKFVQLMVKAKNFNDLNFNVQNEAFIKEEVLLNESNNNNNYFLNTPLFKDYIHFALIKATKNVNSVEESKIKIKNTLCNIIDKFSENKLVKKCAIRISLNCLREINDKESEKYVSEKYSYKLG